MANGRPKTLQELRDEVTRLQGELEQLQTRPQEQRQGGTRRKLTGRRVEGEGLVGDIATRLTRLENELRTPLRQAAQLTPTGAAGQVPAAIRGAEERGVPEQVARPISDAAKQLQNILFGTQVEEQEAITRALEGLSANLGMTPDELRRRLQPTQEQLRLEALTPRQPRETRRQTESQRLIRSLADFGRIRTPAGTQLQFNRDGSIEEIS